MSDIEHYDDDNDSLPAIPDELRGVGLEDTDGSDLRTPRLKINHQQGTFTHPHFESEEFSDFNAVLLGMIKQRVLWQPQLEEDAVPLCRSWDFKEGFPDAVRWTQPFAGSVPLEASHFEAVEDGVPLPCKDCELKEFGTHPINSKAPWCAEQHVYPLLMINEDGEFSPAIFTTAKTGINPSRNYLNPFIINKHPLFTVVTNISLDLNRKGGNVYSVPSFKRNGKTDPKMWAGWAEQFRQIKAYLTTPRDFSDRAEREETTVAAPARKPKAAAKEETIAYDDDDLWSDDEEPF